MLFIHEDGLLYTIENSIFSHHESIWTYNCPCPLQSGCSTRHVCRFKQHTAATTMLGKDEVIAARLTKEYQDLVQLFKQQKDVPVLLGTQYSEFKRFREKLGIHIRHKLCRYASFCNLESCVFAHSIGDMIEPFEDARICTFYKNANIVTCSDKPKSLLYKRLMIFAVAHPIV